MRAQYSEDDDVTDAVIAVAEPGAAESRTAEQPTNERFSVTVPDTSGTPTTPTWSRPSWSTAVTAT